MNVAANRKIAPIHSTPPAEREGNDRVEIGPTQLALDEWAAADIRIPNLDAMREYRLQRLVQQIQINDIDGILMFDPMNIRYATDSTNMQLWNTTIPSAPSW